MTCDGSSSMIHDRPFIFDTGSTSHIIPYKKRFETLLVCSGFLMSTSGVKHPTKGEGTVVLEFVLGDYSVSSF